MNRWHALALGLGALVVVAAIVRRPKRRSPSLADYRPLDTRSTNERIFRVFADSSRRQ